MNNFELFKKDFKRDLLSGVVVALKHGKVDKDGASFFAKNILEIFEKDEAKDVFAKLLKLGETHPDLFDPFILRMNEYDEREKEEKLNNIMEYIETIR